MNGMIKMMLNWNLNKMFMNSIRIIFASLVLVILSSCSIDTLEFPTPNVNNSDDITIIGRMTRFDDYDVDTRAAKQPDEVKITSYAVAIFAVNDDNSIGACKYYKYDSHASQILLTISRYSEDGEVLLYEQGKPYAIYVFANMPGMSKYNLSSSLGDMLKEASSVSSIGIREEYGFPMIGTLGDRYSANIDADGKTFIMYSSLQDNPPTVDGSPISTLNIPMRALFAKVNFEIEVRPDQMIQGSDYPPQFEIRSYVVKNIPALIDFDKFTNADNKGDNIDVFDVEVTNISGGKVASGANTINFSFYLPENLLEPGEYNANNYPYPFRKADGSIRKEDEKYCQRYKGKLLKEGQLATNIVIIGEFRDHQSHSVGVEYTIHLGEDNYSDFNIKRNGEYNNYITIKGILNSDDDTNDNTENYISLDHRVNVKHKEPAIISLRREVLLDSHFEVRPLRIKKNSSLTGNDIPTHVKVEVLTPDITNWMRLERSFGDGVVDGVYPKNDNGEYIYINEKHNNLSSFGKRRYFTVDLVSNTLKNTGKNVVVPLTPNENEDQCVWIYVDECTEIGDNVRTGTICVTYGTMGISGFTPTTNTAFAPVNYVINQRMLYPVSYEGHNYNIEFYEEFLYNFDSEDAFGQTDENGMKWGLENIQLSHIHNAIYLEGSGNNSWDNIAGVTSDDVLAYVNASLSASNINPKYDFYLSRDTNNPNLEIRDYQGFYFNKEIISYLKSQYPNTPEAKVERISLGEKPASAIAYCYNRNKRDANGNVIMGEKTGWYLPAIDEIEEIVKAEYASYFKEFQDNLYWSCQSSYIPNSIHVDRHNWYPIIGWGDWDSNDGKFDSLYYIDDVKNARATKVLSEDGEFKGIPDSGADIYESYPNGIFYLSNGNSSSPNRTVSLGNKTVVNSDYNNIQRHPGNLPRTDMARVRCVRKMN